MAEFQHAQRRSPQQQPPQRAFDLFFSRSTLSNNCTTGLARALRQMSGSSRKRPTKAPATCRRQSSISAGTFFLLSGKSPALAIALLFPVGSGAKPPRANSSVRTTCEAHALSTRAGQPPSSVKLLQRATNGSEGGAITSPSGVCCPKRPAQELNAASNTCEPYWFGASSGTASMSGVNTVVKASLPVLSNSLSNVLEPRWSAATRRTRSPISSMARVANKASSSAETEPPSSWRKHSFK
mmetsp:Transcript_12085/g.30048  ORF Transcript_12085/g.30048 Transcript_12085/m.30048 type:complete len:240 (-) Transcript_12085:367-1086(-)